MITKYGIPSKSPAPHIECALFEIDDETTFAFHDGVLEFHKAFTVKEEVIWGKLSALERVGDGYLPNLRTSEWLKASLYHHCLNDIIAFRCCLKCNPGEKLMMILFPIFLMSKVSVLSVTSLVLVILDWGKRTNSMLC